MPRHGNLLCLGDLQQMGQGQTALSIYYSDCGTIRLKAFKFVTGGEVMKS